MTEIPTPPAHSKKNAASRWTTRTFPRGSANLVPHKAPQAELSFTSRLVFIDALRAFASIMIMWHHFASYPPLSEQAAPILGPIIQWFRDYARTTQVFFVVGGFVMSESMSGRTWNIRNARLFIARRYCRLGLPYVSAIVLAMLVCSTGRGWLPGHVVGYPPTLPQFLAHILFLQELLGHEQLSAGLWFVCINFQLGLIYVGTLFLRDMLAHRVGIPAQTPWIDASVLAGWVLATVSLFHFNLQPGWDISALYFFPYFFMGIIVQLGLRSTSSPSLFWLYLLLIVVGMFYEWRWRLMSCLVVGLTLFWAVKSGLASRWPKNRCIVLLGRTSYSLFLIHFPILVLVATVWAWFGWHSPIAAVTGLLCASIASLAASFAFYRFVEVPAKKMSLRFEEKPPPASLLLRDHSEAHFSAK